MGKALGFAAGVIVFAVLLPDVFAALKILLLKFVQFATIALDAMASAGINIHQ